MGTVVTNWAVQVGTGGAGSKDLFNSGAIAGSASSLAISNLPTDGSNITITLWSFAGGSWSIADSESVTTFIAPPPAAPEITAPLTGTTLTAANVTVTWDAMGTVVTNWAVQVGTGGAGSKDLFNSGAIAGSASSLAISNLPTDGSNITITLWSFAGGSWSIADSESVTTFIAPPPAAPEITAPLTGTTLTAANVTVTWDAMGTVVTNWAVQVGTGGAGSKDLFNSGAISPNLSSFVVSNLPTDGSTVTITLWTFAGGNWTIVDSESVNALLSP